MLIVLFVLWILAAQKKASGNSLIKIARAAARHVPEARESPRVAAPPLHTAATTFDQNTTALNIDLGTENIGVINQFACVEDVCLVNICGLE